MQPRTALPLLVLCAWIAGPSAGRAADVVSVYDLQLEVDAERERLLVFADGPLRPRLISADERTVILALPGASLGLSAPTRLAPVVQGTVVRVTAFDRALQASEPEVRVVVQRRPGEPPRLGHSESVVTVDFEALPRPAPAAEETLSLAGRGAPLRRVVEEIAAATGETVIFDDAVSGLGAITIEGPGRVSRAEARALLDSILLLKGFAMIPTPGGAQKIVPISGAPSPWAPGGELAESDAPVTTLLRLETVMATEIVTLLTPYLGAVSTATAFEPTNSLILTGPASRLRRLRDVVQMLDQLESGVPVFWTLEHADAEETAEQVQEVLGAREVPMAIGDPRTNMLLLRVRQQTLPRARALVDRLDRPSRGQGGLHVIRLRYADPASLAEQLVALRDDAPASLDEDPIAARGGLRGLDFHVVAEPATRSLVLRSSPEAFGPVFDTVRALDVQPPSVRIEVMVATLAIDDRLDLGVDAFIPTLTDPKAPDDLIASVISNPSGGGIPTGPSQARPFIASFTRADLLLTLLDPDTGQPFVLRIPREQFSISLNGRDVRSDTLLRPQLLVVSGEEHEIFAGDNVPIPVARTQGDTDGPTPTGRLQVQRDVERHDVGTSLRVTPTVGAEGGVTLDLDVLVSSLEPSQAGPVERVGPSIREIEIQSRIRLRHGEVAVIATESQPIVQRRETGVPWLKDIPGLGFLFRASTDQTMERHLLVSARAEILRPEARDLARALAEQLGPLEAWERTADAEAP